MISSMRMNQREHDSISSTNGCLKIKNGVSRQVSVGWMRIHFVVGFLLNTVGSTIFTAVYVWHFTEAAALLPGAKGFGWFYRFVTFWSWTLQTLQYYLAGVLNVLPMKFRSHTLIQVVDDLSCLAFTIAATVTTMFWTLHFTTGGMVERSGARPPWLGFAVHIANFILACLDIILMSPRSFHRRVFVVLIPAFATSYASWLAVCRYMNGRFPYPFMNGMPAWVAFVGTTALCTSAMFALGLMGANLARASDWLLQKPASITLKNGLESNGSRNADKTKEL